MFHKLAPFCVFFLIASVSSKEFEKNNLSCKEVSTTDVCIIANEEIPVLQDGVIADIANMRVLRLLEDNISRIKPGAFRNLPKLKSLDISDNKLEEIEAGVFNSLNLKDLDLSSNQISTIAPNAFDNMITLELIILSNNTLTRWDVQWFANTPNLRWIHLSYNLIETIPANVIPTPKEGTGSFYIFLEGNRIKKINSNAFQNLKQISVLSLNANLLETLDVDFLGNNQVGELYLNANKIQCGEEKIEKKFAKIFAANLTQIIDNPLEPNCLDNIKKWAKQHQKDIQFDLPSK